MEKVKKRKGISLIVLVITILVMVILAGVVVVTMSENNPIKKAKEANFKSDLVTFQEDLSMHIANLLAADTAVKVVDIDAKGYDAIKKVVDSFTKKYENKIEVVDGKIVYVGTDKDELAWAGSAGVTSKAGMVNAPVLSSGMLPVKYNGAKWEICSSSDPAWYNYENKQWANVMLSDGKYKEATVGTVVEDADLGSMFVWIPRFAYSINKYKTEVAGEGSTQLIHDITFLTGTSNSDVDGKVYGKSYDAKTAAVGKATPKIVHPAFNFGGTEMQGLWVAKFEAGMQENDVHKNNMTAASCDFAAANSVKVTPGIVTWRYLTFGNMFLNCLKMAEQGNIYGLANADTHLIKNVDWGAVATLTTSKYGVTPVQSRNSSKVAGSAGDDGYKVWAGGAETTYRKNGEFSTTGNITGIFDMNGGAWEYVAACYPNNNVYLSQNGGEVFPGNAVNSAYTKYLDIYSASAKETDASLHYKIATAPGTDATYGNVFKKSLSSDRVANMATSLGDTMYEFLAEGKYSFSGTLPTGEIAWMLDVTDTSPRYGTCNVNGDTALVGSIYNALLIRGGFWKDDGTTSGIFASHGHYGPAKCYYGFRPVITNM